MKKLLSVILAIFMAFSCFAVSGTSYAASCNHPKNYVKPYVVHKATNQDNGLISVRCSKCGKRFDSIINEKIPRVTEYHLFASTPVFQPDSIKMPKASAFFEIKIAGIPLTPSKLSSSDYKILKASDFTYDGKISKKAGVNYRTVKLSNKYYNQSFKVAYCVRPYQPKIKKATIQKNNDKLLPYKITIQYKPGKNNETNYDSATVYLKYKNGKVQKISNASLNKTNKTITTPLPYKIGYNDVSTVNITLNKKASPFTFESKRSKEIKPKIVIKIK